MVFLRIHCPTGARGSIEELWGCTGQSYRGQTGSSAVQMGLSMLSLWELWLGGEEGEGQGFYAYSSCIGQISVDGI